MARGREDGIRDTALRMEKAKRTGKVTHGEGKHTGRGKQKEREEARYSMGIATTADWLDPHQEDAQNWGRDSQETAMGAEYLFYMKFIAT